MGATMPSVAEFRHLLSLAVAGPQSGIDQALNDVFATGRREYTSNIQAAITLFAHALPGFQWLVRSDESGLFLVNVHRDNESPNHGHSCWPTWERDPALALVISMLKAGLETKLKEH
jgi:hypothetical protein